MSGWRESAACRGLDPELFHPDRGEDVRPALAVCATCSVTEPCREQALADFEVGVWGATTERQRRIIRRGIRIEVGAGNRGPIANYLRAVAS